MLMYFLVTLIEQYSVLCTCYRRLWSVLGSGRCCTAFARLYNHHVAIANLHITGISNVHLTLQVWPCNQTQNIHMSTVVSWQVIRPCARNVWFSKWPVFIFGLPVNGCGGYKCIGHWWQNGMNIQRAVALLKCPQFCTPHESRPLCWIKLLPVLHGQAKSISIVCLLGSRVLGMRDSFI